MSDVEDPAALMQAALEEHARRLSNDEWRLFVAKTRPPDYSQFRDPADREKAILSGIAAKSQRRPRVDHNGYPVVVPEKGTTK